MKEKRPMSAYPSVQNKQAVSTRLQDSDCGEPRPNTGLTVRMRVLKPNSTAFNNWLRRGNEYQSFKKQTHNYKSVETFNLRPGGRVTKSASQLRVNIDPDEFFNPKVPKIAPTEIPVKEMESLIRNLQEQVRYLTVYLEEEKLHHDGTKKRAKVDLLNLRAEMDKQHEEDVEKVMQDNQDYIEEIRKEHRDLMTEMQEELRRQNKTLEKEYKLLQASFRNYKSKVAKDMDEKWENKRREFDWDKQRSIDNAVEATQRSMEEKFNKERVSIRSEYKELMQQMIADQRQEMEEFMRKMSDGKSSMEDLKAKAERADQLEQELKETRESLKATQLELREISVKLVETSSKLAVYENQFEEKVNAVEDKYRKRIDDLVNEVSGFRMLLIKKAETQYLERAASDELQKKWTEFTKKKLEERIATTSPVRNASAAIRRDEILTESTPEPAPEVQLNNMKEFNNDASSNVVSEQHTPAAYNTLATPLSVTRKPITTGIPRSASPKRKRSPRKIDAATETRGKDITATKAGVDKIRPRLPISTVTLLDTADLPYASAEEYRPEGCNSSRPPSPDVIY